MKKTLCPVTRPEFLENAKALAISIDGKNLSAPAKEFSTGSLGWYLNGKTDVTINGKTVTVQIGMNLTVVGSKDLPKAPDSTAEEYAEEVAAGQHDGFDK